MSFKSYFLYPGCLLMMALQPACFGLDGFVHNPVHCSEVGAKTCEEESVFWDRVCVPCDTEYDFTVEYPWMPSTLQDSQTIQPINAGDVLRQTIETKDGAGTLDTYFIRAFAGSVNSQTTVLYNHGNYAGIEHYLPRIQLLYQSGFNVLVWDYRGYGKSEPNLAPTPEEFISDARQVREWADTVIPDARKLIIYAYSLGGIPAMEMATHRAPCALIWEAGFTSMSAISRSNSTLSMGETFLSQGYFNNIEKAKSYPGPLFALIGDRDIKFPVEDVQRLVDHAAGPKTLWVLPGVNHGIANGGVPEAGLEEYLNQISTFLENKASGCL